MREKVEAELKLLKAQLNPHFLFNTLNNLYYLASEKSDDAPKAILALSEILDYVMHAGSRQQVALRTELDQVRHFVELEIMRYRDRVTIDIEVTGEIDNYVVVPMTLITLMENAFKHGVMPSAQPSWINLQIAPGASGLAISVTNSVSGQLQRRGLGLDNLRHQLDLVLGERYSLETYSDDRVFSAKLILQP
ncbi:MAG: histidine kinase [Bacteroidia bacterium]|nr:histidine kinase [Bacteroidia bacterium]